MKWIAGKIVDQKQWAPGLFSLYFEAPLIDFIPGQFVQICLDPNLKLFRPYSLVNVPSEPIYEIYYTLVKGGGLTSQLATVNVNDTVWISEKAHGRFVLDEIDSAQSLWLFATGTGLGPFLSMLKTQAPWQKFKKIILVHSVRFNAELTHQHLINEMLAQYPLQFQAVSIVTREKAIGAFNERIPTLLQNGALEEQIGASIRASNAQVMLCGNPAMVQEVTQCLAQRGLKVSHHKDKGHISFENYWKSNEG